MQVHTLARVCTYSGTIGSCTCTSPPPSSVTNRNHPAFPVQGRLLVRDVRVTTRMGRTVRYLVPAFTTP